MSARRKTSAIAFWTSSDVAAANERVSSSTISRSGDAQAPEGVEGADVRGDSRHAPDVTRHHAQLVGFMRRTMAQVDLGHLDIALVGAAERGKNPPARRIVAETSQRRGHHGTTRARGRDPHSRELAIELTCRIERADRLDFAEADRRSREKLVDHSDDFRQALTRR
jgi:hypothetical protein